MSGDVHAERHRIRHRHRIDSWKDRDLVSHAALKIAGPLLIVPLQTQIEPCRNRPARVEADVDRGRMLQAPNNQQRTNQQRRRECHLQPDDDVSRVQAGPPARRVLFQRRHDVGTSALERRHEGDENC